MSVAMTLIAAAVQGLEVLVSELDAVDQHVNC